MNKFPVFLDERALSARTGLSRRTLQRLRASGYGPLFARLSARRIVYRLDDVEAWASSNSFPHRAAEMAAKTRK